MAAIRWIAMLALGVACALLVPACGDDDDDSTDSAADDDNAADDDGAADDDNDDDNDDDDDETPPHGPGFPDIFTYPNDGRLYAAAGCVTITPNETNHPAPIYLAGTDLNRVAIGVHDELHSCMLVLGVGDQYLFIAAMDVIGVPAPRIKIARDALQDDHGVDPDRFLVHATHCHNGPDTLGVYGPDDYTTGRDPIYDQFLSQTLADQAVALAPEMVAAELKVAATTINDPLSNYPNYLRDFRYPMVTDDALFAAQLVASDGGGAVATIVNWTNHPEIASDGETPDDVHLMVSADFAARVRERLEMEYGGVGLYWTGAEGGMTTPFGVAYPLRDEAGQPVLSGGEPVYVSEENWDKVRSLGFVLGEIAIQALNSADVAPVPRIDAARQDVRFPLANLSLYLAMELGILEKQDIVREPGCGLLGCLAQPIWLYDIGDAWQILTSPGESFPESTIGREASSHDFGDPDGVIDFPAMPSLREHYSAACAMYLALAGNEIGYIVPETDWNHDPPNNYCEYFSLGPRTDTLLRQSQLDLLDQAARRNR